MRELIIGFISDVHSNLPALESVLDRLGSMGAQEIFCAGDLIGYYPFPVETLRLLRDRKVRCISGNHDHALLSGTSGMNSKAAAAIEWTRRNITEDSFEFLRALPGNMKRPIGNVMTSMFHGSPGDRNEYVFENLAHREMLIGTGSGLLVLGHTHIPFVLNYMEGTIINPGSVGQPRDGDPRAAAIILDTTKWTFEIVRTVYDVEMVRERTLEAGLPALLAERLLVGR